MSVCILWFRQDFRLHDNLALLQALEEYDCVYPIYIHDTENAEKWTRGSASRVWLNQSLKSLDESMGGDRIQYFHGKADSLLPDLVKRLGADAVYWNRCYEPWRMTRDKKIKETLKNQDIKTESFNASLLWEPWRINKDDGTPYRVFTPFYRKGCLGYGEPDTPLPAPDQDALKKMRTIDSDAVKGLEGSVADLESLSLLPHVSEGGWNDAMIKRWDISEQGALDRFEHFVQHGLKGYKEDRNRPDLDHVSMLSPYLHNGQISVRYLWHRVQALRAENDIPEKDADHFLSELGWREFSYNLLYNNHTLPEQNLQGKFDAFPWADPENDQYAAEALQKWQEGMTGYPIVDAGMRQLYATGWMHNRVRMIVGSFLVKHLLLHWHHGEAWFWDCLVDADLANNAASWQWIAGSGADAAPYFRIFNPMTQGKKFDPNADYVRQWVPELKDLPDKHIHTPWEAPDDVLKLAGVQPGKNYPKPIVDHFEARDRALEAFQSLKKDAA